MAESVNLHYDKLINDIGSKKDSIFEPCRIVSFDSKTLMATTYGIRSKSVKKNVIVMFPSMYMNTGIISFPVKDSVGVNFIGVDNETYFMPAQFFPPIKETKNSSVSSNASPSQFDELLSLENLEPGEHLIRALGGSQIYVRNTGEIEIATSKMHRLSLNELEGSLETIVERTRQQIGHSEFFNGSYDPKNSDDSFEHHIYAKYFERVPDWETDEVLSKELTQKLISASVPTEDIFPLKEEKPVASMQMVNVYEEDNDLKKKSTIDQQDLFYDFSMFKEMQNILKECFKVNVSKNGALQIISGNLQDGLQTEIIQKVGEFKATVNRNGTKTSMSVDSTGATLTHGSTKVKVVGGEVIVSDRKGTYTLASLVERIEILESMAHTH